MVEKEKKMLVAVDGTERSLLTIRYLAQFSLFHNMPVKVMHVFVDVPDAYWDLEKEPASVKFAANLRAWRRNYEERITVYMEKCRGMLLEGGFPEENVSTCIHPLKKSIARDIFAEARKGYHAVVLRRRGMAFLGDMIIGSVASKLMQKLDSTPIILAGTEPVNQHVMIALDGSDCSTRAVDFVGSVIAGSSIKVSLLHVVRHQEWLIQQNFSSTDAHIGTSDDISTMFQYAAERLSAQGVAPEKISTKLITGVHSRAGAIVEEAKKRQCSTIVVGRRGLSRVQEFYMGRVGHKVIQAAKKHSVWIVS